MAGIAVKVVPSGGLPVRDVASGAPEMKVVATGGIPITLSARGVPFVVTGAG